MSSLRSLNSSSSTSRAFSLQNLSVCTMPHLECDEEFHEEEVGAEREYEVIRRPCITAISRNNMSSTDRLIKGAGTHTP